MQERNVISGVAATMAVPFVEDAKMVVVWLAVAFVLILVDLRFGIRAARERGEAIRKSRAARRTINKMVDYICWICLAWVIGGSFGRIFHVPLLAAIIMVIVASIELTSIFDNYFEARGIKKRVNVFRIFAKVLKIDIIADAVEDTEDNNKQDKQA